MFEDTRDLRLYVLPLPPVQMRSGSLEAPCRVRVENFAEAWTPVVLAAMAVAVYLVLLGKDGEEGQAT